VAALGAEVHLLRRALEALPLGVVVRDDTGALVFHNRQASDLVDPRHGDALVTQALEELLEAAAGGGVHTRSLDLRAPLPRTVEIVAEALGGDGVVAVVDDVTERRRLEAVRRDFVANVSHELRTPVGALALLAETLASEDDPKAARRLAEHLTVEAQRVGRMIEDLLDLGRLEAQPTDHRAGVKIAEVVHVASARVTSTADRRSVALNVSRVPDDAVVTGDHDQLVSAVANLLDNAVKYSEPGSAADVVVERRDGAVEISVRDHGIGIPSRDLPRIFERFYRVDPARSRETGGTGLGLAIVRHVAANHGGEILVESREGEGSTFILRLPAAPA
jgi:two-component system sensor histidine kinase SenX3